jgi:hypothetical protein
MARQPGQARSRPAAVVANAIAVLNVYVVTDPLLVSALARFDRCQ